MDLIQCYENENSEEDSDNDSAFAGGKGSVRQNENLPNAGDGCLSRVHTEPFQTQSKCETPKSKMTTKVVLDPPKGQEQNVGCHDQEPPVSQRTSSPIESKTNDGGQSVETFDFFGFSMSQPQQHTPLADNIAMDPCSTSSVEVPDSDFWSSFIPDPDTVDSGSQDTRQVIQTSHEVYYKRQTEEYDYEKTNNDAYNLTTRRIPSVVRACSSNEVRNSSHPYLGWDERRTLSTNSYQVSTVPKKIFYVHSKVAPYLHADHTSKSALNPTSTWCAHEGSVNKMAWNQTNYSHLLVTAGMDSKVHIWNVWSSSEDKCVSTLHNHKKAVKYVDWCQNGRSVFSCSYDRTAQVTDVETGQVKGELDHTGFVTAGTKHPSNPHIVATGTDNMALMWDIRTPQAPVKHFTHKEAFGQIQDLLFICDGREVVSCADCVSRDSADRSIMVWDVRSTAVLSNQIYQERYTCTRLKLHTEKSHFLAQSHGGYVALFSTSSPYKMEKSKRFGEHKLLGYSIGFDLSPDGKLVYSGSAEGGVHCYDYRTGRLLRKLKSGVSDVIMDVACHPVLPSVLASCSWGGCVRMWQ